MPHQSRLDRLKIHMKKLNKQKAKLKLKERKKRAKEEEEGPQEPVRNLKSEIISATWDLKHNQLPHAKLRFIRAIVKQYQEEMDGVETEEIKAINKLLGGLEKDETSRKVQRKSPMWYM